VAAQNKNEIKLINDKTMVKIMSIIQKSFLINGPEITVSIELVLFPLHDKVVGKSISVLT